MRKFAILLAAGLGLAATAAPAIAAPAQGQGYHRGGGGDRHIDARQARAQVLFQRANSTGLINREEARSIRGKLRMIEVLDQRYRASRPGLTAVERRDLNNRLANVERSIEQFKRNRSYRR